MSVRSILTSTLVCTLLSLFVQGLASGEEIEPVIQGDAARGRVVFLKCQSCHSLLPDGSARLGPNLNNLFGRKAGTLPNYQSYSKALRESAIIWDERTLDEWLRNPQNFLPGNKMPFAGIRSEQERADLMAFLKKTSQLPNNEKVDTQ